MLVNKGFLVDYYDCENNFSSSYESKLEKSIKKNKPNKIWSFEIEDKPFEKKIIAIPSILKTINWLRKQSDKEPIIIN